MLVDPQLHTVAVASLKKPGARWFVFAQLRSRWSSELHVRGFTMRNDEAGAWY